MRPRLQHLHDRSVLWLDAAEDLHDRALLWLDAAEAPASDLVDDDAAAWRAVVVWYGTLALLVPARTRPFAHLGLTWLLSRAHGSGLRRAMAHGSETIERLFSERTSVARSLDELREDFERLREGQRINAEHMDRQVSDVAEKADAIAMLLDGMQPTPIGEATFSQIVLAAPAGADDAATLRAALRNLGIRLTAIGG